MLNNIKIFSLGFVLPALLVACGGSSDSSGSNYVGGENTETNTVITQQCSEANNQITVTKAGCIFNAGGTQTGVCTSSNALKMLSGTGHTAKKVTDEGATFANGVTINGKTIKCATS